MHLQVYVIFITCAISQNIINSQDFFKAQLSPSTLTSVPYLDGEVTVYEHLQNSSRLFVPPLAALYLNQTRVFYNRLSDKYLLRLSLILFTNELRTTILRYVSNTRNRCSPPLEICDIKMVPTERLRVIWKRSTELSSNYKLDTSWQSNTALLNKVDVHIECSTNQTCYDLLNDILETPEILNGLELQYSTQTEKQIRKTVTITGEHIMKTPTYSQLKQIPSSTTGNNTHYLLVDDMNQFITEILTKMELEEITDSDYIAQDDHNILADLMKKYFSLNVEILHDHTERQWNSVYWNSNNIRPDRIVHLLNDELKRLQNRTIVTHQNQSSFEQQQNQRDFNLTHTQGSHDNSENVSGSGRNKTDRLSNGEGSSSTEQNVIDRSNSVQSQNQNFGQSASDMHHGDHSSNNRFGINLGFGGFSVGMSPGSSNKHMDAGSSSRSAHGIIDWRNALSKYNDYSHQGSNIWKNTTTTSDDLSFYNKSAWRRAANQDQRTAHDLIGTEADAQSFQDFRHNNFDFYTNNRQFIEFTEYVSYNMIYALTITG
ncbi:unnamed protein product [Rotaria sordida]|uniref:Uncharacterized protein n=1 Tax=Rotaria sordida TaxID=392033 RepID=A0A814X7C3_9BILA|nr:unnamed protein product [Rotaria sordida]CAF1285923.1 unnamed protein product [Rotaria sordida]CAF1330675.1 unnamed protein product [Rotaria sordida]CAF1489683.1 unnamed protein product [Rotaria sordida]CAF3943505.1 unnamed protein product [Rotaria sordida]